MSGKSFTLALIGVAAVGVAIAVGFIAATNLGEGDVPDALATQMAPASSGVGAQAQAAVSSASQAATDAEGQLTAGGVQTLAGTLKEVEGNRLTIETQDGAVTAIVEEGAALNLFLKVAPEDLEEGATLTIIGERGEDGITQASSILVGVGGSGIGGSPGGVGLPSGARGRVAVQALTEGQVSPQELAELRRQLGSAAASGDAGQLPPEVVQRMQGLLDQPGGLGLAPRGGLTGTIQGISDNIITIETPRGALKVSFGEDTDFREMKPDGLLSDIPIDSEVRLIGQVADDGVFHAAGVFMVPGNGGFGVNVFGGQGRPGGFQPPQPGSISP